MVKGKSTCKLLKDIRQQIADANGISYQPKECHHKGDCAGTCPACEEEIRYLERELKARKGNASVVIDGTNKGIATNVDGQFALKVPSDTSLVVSSIGYNNTKVRVSSLLRSDNNVIMLKKLVLKGLFEVVTVSPNYDDVYGHRTYKPKSHKEKNKKKCK